MAGQNLKGDQGTQTAFVTQDHTSSDLWARIWWLLMCTHSLHRWDKRWQNPAPNYSRNKCQEPMWRGQSCFFKCATAFLMRLSWKVSKEDERIAHAGKQWCAHWLHVQTVGERAAWSGAERKKWRQLHWSFQTFQNGSIVFARGFR